MKEKLKTLKNIERIERDYDWVYSSELKAEAIKWIKEARRRRKEATNYDAIEIDGVSFQPCSEYDCDVVDRWIIHFFNIREEDLK